MTARQVAVGMVTYTDPSGVPRFGVQGETVQVHSNDLKRFDALNGGAPKAATKATSTPKQTPKRRPRPRKG